SGTLAACVTIPDQPRNLAPDSGGGASGGSAGSGASAGSAANGGIPIPDSGICPNGFKPCAAQCVPLNDPAYGCTSTGCEACPSGARVATLGCEAEKCVALTCQPGFGDGNGDLDDGCEQDTSADPE